MRSMRVVVGVVLALGVTIGATSVANAAGSVIFDGNFEHPVLGPPGFSDFVAGQTLGPWSVTRGTVLLAQEQPGFEMQPLGSQALSLTGAMTGGGGQVCQPVAGLVPGASYSIRVLAASLVPDSRAGQSSTIDLTLGGASVAHLVLPATNPAVFARHDFTVEAVAAHERFCIAGKPSELLVYPFVDSVAIKPIG